MKNAFHKKAEHHMSKAAEHHKLAKEHMAKAAKHSDIKEDKALIKKVVKPTALKK